MAAIEEDGIMKDGALPHLLTHLFHMNTHSMKGDVPLIQSDVSTQISPSWKSSNKGAQSM